MPPKLAVDVYRLSCVTDLSTVLRSIFGYEKKRSRSYIYGFTKSQPFLNARAESAFCLVSCPANNNPSITMPLQLAPQPQRSDVRRDHSSIRSSRLSL